MPKSAAARGLSGVVSIALAKGLLHLHVPVVGPTRWLFRAFYGLHVGVREAGIGWFASPGRSRCSAASVNRSVQDCALSLPYMNGHGRIRLGTDVEIGGLIDISFNNRFHASPELIVGNDRFIGHYCVFTIAESVRIGNHCLISGGVVITDYDGHPLDADRRRAKNPMPAPTSAP